MSEGGEKERKSRGEGESAQEKKKEAAAMKFTFRRFLLFSGSESNDQLE
jgi:hypothetical protein